MLVIFLRDIVIVFFVFALSVCHAAGNSLVLTEGNLGSLTLDDQTTISVEILNKHFPEYTVKQGIGHGDSVDFHYFTLSDQQHKILTMYSFIYADDQPNNTPVRLDLIDISSADIQDTYGIKVGMTITDVIAVRGDDLSFGAGHHDNYIGQDNVWYSLSTKPLQNTDGVDINPVMVTKPQAIKRNLPINHLLWPHPRW